MMRRVTHDDDFAPLAKLLNEAFAAGASEFGLTRGNNPTNNAFITPGELRSQLTDRREFYCYEPDGEPAGFIAIEKSGKQPGKFYIEKVAVHPAHRHSGLGRRLMDFAEQRIRELGGDLISIGLINNNIRLKEWYRSQGFVQTEVKSFDHLPFEVCIMEKAGTPAAV